MRRDLKIFFLAIGLPAVLLALGGLRLLQVEADNARKIGSDVLQAKANLAAADIRHRIREHVDSVFDQIDQLPVRNAAALTDLAARDPLVQSIVRRPKLKLKKGLYHRQGFAVELDPSAVATQIPAWLTENGTISADTNDVESATTAGLRTREGKVLFKAPGANRNMFTVGAPLAPELPNLRLFVGWRHATARTEQARFRIYLIGATVLALLVASLFGGMFMLMRIAAQARREARQQTDFTAGVSHEFKTPLTAIALAAEFARSHTREPETQQALDDVLEESAKLSHLVADVLELGKMSEGKPLPTEPTDVGDGVYALANPPAFEHIVSNLLDNAAKYAPDTAAERRVRQEGSTVLVEILDRGPGMTATEMRNAFRPYWRADTSVTRARGGCGLGLTIARHLARMQGGDLTVAAREGGGCVFTLKLKSAEVENG